MVDKVKAPKLAIGQMLFFLACALLVGFVGGRSVAESAGVIENGRDSEQWLVFSQVLLALFTFASLRFLFLLGRRMVAVLAGVQTRPSREVAVVIVLCGVLCLLAAVVLQWHESSTSASVSASVPTIQVPGMPNVVTNAGVFAIRARTSLTAPITTLGVLLAGLVIIGIGVWSSIPPRPIPLPMQNGNTQDIRAESFAGADRPRE